MVDATKMPFNTYKYCIDCTCKDKNHGVVQTTLATDSRGRLRPGWEIFYCHYAKVKGLSSGFTYVKAFADKLRPEAGAGDTDRYGDNSGAFDQARLGHTDAVQIIWDKKTINTPIYIIQTMIKPETLCNHHSFLCPCVNRMGRGQSLPANQCPTASVAFPGQFQT